MRAFKYGEVIKSPVTGDMYKVADLLGRGGFEAVSAGFGSTGKDWRSGFGRAVMALDGRTAQHGEGFDDRSPM